MAELLGQACMLSVKETLNRDDFVNRLNLCNPNENISVDDRVRAKKRYLFSCRLAPPPPQVNSLIITQSHQHTDAVV